MMMSGVFLPTPPQGEKTCRQEKPWGSTEGVVVSVGEVPSEKGGQGWWVGVHGGGSGSGGGGGGGGGGGRNMVRLV